MICENSGVRTSGATHLGSADPQIPNLEGPHHGGDDFDRQYLAQIVVNWAAGANWYQSRYGPKGNRSRSAIKRKRNLLKANTANAFSQNLSSYVIWAALLPYMSILYELL